MRAIDRIRPSLVEWLTLAAGAALIVHRRWLFDDAFIYFRYVDNLLFLRGGLTFNVGEYVEGYTSPGFCLLLAALRSTHLGFPEIVLLVGLGSYLVFWALLVRLNRLLAPPGATAWNLPLLLLASHYGVTSFFTSGVETPLVQVAAVAYALLVLRPRSVPLAVLVALSPLARPELFASLALVALWAWWRGKRFPTVLVGTAVAANGAWLVYRIRTYADLLPNTFYLKDGTHWAMGLRYLRDFTDVYHAVPASLLLLALAFVLWSRRERDADLGPFEAAPRVAMVAIAAIVAAYVVRIGGAAIHYQYLAFPFVLAVCATAGLAERALAVLPGRGTRWAAWGAAAAVFALVATFHPTRVGTSITRLEYHRSKRSLHPDTWRDAVAIEEQRRFAPEVHAAGYARTTITGSCRDLYVQYRNRSVHRFGLTDGILAHVDTPERRRGHKPGLTEPAKDILAIQAAARVIGRGMFREAVEAGRAPDWVRENLDTIEILEKKMYNRHDFRENLGLALTFPPRIRVEGGPEEADGDEEREADDVSGSAGPSRPGGA